MQQSCIIPHCPHPSSLSSIDNPTLTPQCRKHPVQSHSPLVFSAQLAQTWHFPQWPRCNECTCLAKRTRIPPLHLRPETRKSRGGEVKMKNFRNGSGVLSEVTLALGGSCINKRAGTVRCVSQKLAGFKVEWILQRGDF